MEFVCVRACAACAERISHVLLFIFHSFGAPSLSVLCFYGLCYDAMPLPIGTILEKLKKTDKPLSVDHVSADDIHELQCKINVNPQMDLRNLSDDTLTAVLIAFLKGLRESVLAPTTATEFIISAGQCVFFFFFQVETDQTRQMNT